MGEAELVKLVAIVKRIPWYCGNPNCYNDACLAIREARDLIREINPLLKEIQDEVNGQL